MSYSGIIAQINIILSSATGLSTAKIYNYDRLSRQWDEYISSFKDTTNNVVHGWTITRNKLAEMPEASRTNTVTTTWILRGYYSLGSSGATETTFQGIIDNIRTAFISKTDLNNSCLTTSPIQVDIIEPRMFGDVLCHYAELRLETIEEVTYT